MQIKRKVGAQRGTTLIEVLIVVAIMSMVAGAVAVAVMRQAEKAKLKAALVDARGLRAAVKMWWLEDRSGCPTFGDLVESGTLDEDNDGVDPWGRDYRIRCDGSRVSVSSDGPDRVAGTENDVRVPPIERVRKSTADQAGS